MNSRNEDNKQLVRRKNCKSFHCLENRAWSKKMKDEERNVFETHVRVDNRNALVLIFRAGRNVNVQSWSLEFEEMCDVCGWIDVQRVIYAKRLLRVRQNYSLTMKCALKVAK